MAHRDTHEIVAPTPSFRTFGERIVSEYIGGYLILLWHNIFIVEFDY